MQAALGHNWCGRQQTRISASGTRPELVRVALGQNWCRQLRARIGVGGNLAGIGVNSTRPELLWTTPSRNTGQVPQKCTLSRRVALVTYLSFLLLIASYGEHSYATITTAFVLNVI